MKKWSKDDVKRVIEKCKKPMIALAVVGIVGAALLGKAKLMYGKYDISAYEVGNWLHFPVGNDVKAEAHLYRSYQRSLFHPIAELDNTFLYYNGCCLLRRGDEEKDNVTFLSTKLSANFNPADPLYDGNISIEEMQKKGNFDLYVAFEKPEEIETSENATVDEVREAVVAAGYHPYEDIYHLDGSQNGWKYVSEEADENLGGCFYYTKPITKGIKSKPLVAAYCLVFDSAPTYTCLPFCIHATSRKLVTPLKDVDSYGDGDWEKVARSALALPKQLDNGWSSQNWIGGAAFNVWSIFPDYLCSELGLRNYLRRVQEMIPKNK